MNKKKIFRFMTMVYIISLGAVLGAVVYAGAVVAPNIFHSELYLLGKEINIPNYSKKGTHLLTPKISLKLWGIFGKIWWPFFYYYMRLLSGKPLRVIDGL